jgi:hypothetical protein
VEISSSVWLLIVLALLAANLPFVNERVFALIASRRFARAKPFWIRLIELAVLYFILGGVAYLLEARLGNVFIQTWEFYAITVFLFLVLGFPGFVYRYLRKSHG